MKFHQVPLTIFSILFTIFSCNNHQKKKDKTSEKPIEHKSITAEEALVELKYGNNRFLDDMSKNTNYKEQIEATKGGQHPIAFVLTCIDSRVPPEIVFDQGIGNIFVARVAGNVEDEDMLGSMEFAAKVKHTKLFVVMGHSHCGAVKGAMDNVGLEHLTQLTNKIKPAINEQKTYPLEDEIEDNTSRENVHHTIESILKNSATLRNLVEEKEIKIVGAFYDIANGEVEFFKESKSEK
ncbi:MAG: carbonic anhydrase family protein [Bacteroidetes bacterium]|nr:carbonic anhydrase family protein [Bacteroidota bacterium]